MNTDFSENQTFYYSKDLINQFYSNRGVAAGNEVTVLALMWMIAGHQKHHINILREKYLQ